MPARLRHDAKRKAVKSLTEKYPPSKPCGCTVCLAYCKRPGWWTVAEAGRALVAGYGNRMMLEIAPEGTFGVLSPAFYGCEGDFALQVHASRGCNFLKQDRCELHGTGFQPLECRFCHHNRTGMGPKCHADLEVNWETAAGRALVERWLRDTGLLERVHFLGLEKILPSPSGYPASPER